VLRRNFIRGIIGLSATGPIRASAQPSAQTKRIGVLLPYTMGDAEGQAVLTELRTGLSNFGWREGVVIKFEDRWSGGDFEIAKANAAELRSLPVDIIYADGNSQLVAATKSAPDIPIVFLGASSALESGIVKSFARPGGSVTGFTLFEPSLSGKWLEALKEMSPAIERALMIFNPNTASGGGTFYQSSFELAADAMSVKAINVAVRSVSDLEDVFTEHSGRRDTGVVVQPDTFLINHREIILKAAAKHKLATAYPMRYFAKMGGLMSYGPDKIEICRRSTIYLDRILRGTNPGELPVQAPTKYEFVINQKTATELGLSIPRSLLVRADEIIE
jgi:putative tryptophan/tyrosine transport system substrate-binding protein